MANQIAQASCDPPSPAAGTKFTLTVTLSSAAVADIIVKLEKQRLIPGGGAFQTTPIVGNTYFAPNLDPKPITIKTGASAGTSDPIEVSRNASIGDPPPTPVVFPDYVLFTAYTDVPKNGVPLLVAIQPRVLK
jgi:hypothetical protein